jgi:CheY-like chemotaxis protein
VGGNLYLCKPIDPQKLLRYIDYFLEQTGLTASGNIDPNAPDPIPVVSEAVRVLTIDYNIENHRVLQRLFGQSKGEHARVNGGPFEMLWAEDPRQAMVDLTRWDPDAILYNPRNPGMDGAAFGKILGMHETGPKPQTAFVGTRFTKADHDFSNAHFGREVIELGLDLQKSCMRLNEVVAEARKQLRPKRHDSKFIEMEIADRSQNRSLGDLKKTRERDTQRQRFQTIQAYIDRQFS